MVNYLYDLEKVEQNHETFVSEKKINISKNAKNNKNVIIVEFSIVESFS